jgi:hypothetical protein
MIKIYSVEIGGLPSGNNLMSVEFTGTPIHTEVFTSCFLELLRRFDPDGSDVIFSKIKDEMSSDKTSPVVEAILQHNWDTWDVHTNDDKIVLEFDKHMFILDTEDAKNIASELERKVSVLKRRDRE